MYRVYVHEEYCMGCRLCEVYCLVGNSRSGHVLKAYRDENPPPQARILVEEAGYFSFAVQCRHCSDAPCIDACITGAMHRDENTGAVISDSEKCVGCWSCIMVCPLGVIQRGSQGKKIISKCDLCPGKEKPACAANCPNEALEVVYVKE